LSVKGIEQVTSVQLQYSYFPVREAELKTRIEYVTLMPEQSIQIGSAKVTPCLLNHPVIDFGYRIECNGKSIFFTSDHELPYNIYQPSDEGHDEYQVFVDEKAKSIQDTIRGVDVFIADCTYTDAEYPAKKGWGHMALLALAFVQRTKLLSAVLFRTHHEPARSDDALENVFAAALAENKALTQGMAIRLARQGETYEF
jgi:hypothetical protein